MEEQIKLLSLIVDDKRLDAFRASEYLVALYPELSLKEAFNKIIDYRS